MSTAQYALLALAADTLDDLERARMAAKSRFRHMTRDEVDKDGGVRDLGLSTDVPEVLALAALVDGLTNLEHQAELALKRSLRQHPLGPWVKVTLGVGEKQGARLLAAIGDPYWNTLHNRPRTVSELWAFCGYHVLPVGGQDPRDTHTRIAAGRDLKQAGGAVHEPSDAQRRLGVAPSLALTLPASHTPRDAHSRLAGGAQAGTGQRGDDTQSSTAGADHSAGGDAGHHIGVAPGRARGQKSNWSSTAKMRAFLIAESCMQCRQSPYRAAYDDTRLKYAEATHQVECRRCGPAGRPAQPGSPLSDGHKHARALRLVAKTILRDLWREGKRLHDLDHGITPAEAVIAAPAKAAS